MDLPELLFNRMRPRAGWGRMLGGLLAVLCLPFAAGAGKLDLPVGAFFWAALGGYLLGLWSAPDEPLVRRARRALRWGAWLLVGGLGGALLVLSVDNALPPLALVAQDAGALGGWLVRAVRARTVGVPLALVRAWVFMAEALPRFGRDVLAAPDGGRAGARLIVALGGVALGWVGALLLGWALARGRALLFWGLPLLLALALTTIFGGAGGAPLVGGLALLLGVVLSGEQRWRERRWLRSGTDFSEELRLDALLGGGTLVVGVLLLALALPTALDSPLSALLWRDVEPPSGIAALEAQARPVTSAPAVPIGLSRLPALALGLSLEQGAPAQPALRVQVGAPLPDGPFPHYWRARLFNIYTGRGWTNNAFGQPQPALPFTEAPPGTIVQTVEDQRRDRGIVVALPNLIAVDIPTTDERLSDGTLAATTKQAAARYRVLSRPIEQAAPPAPGVTPPDLTPFMGLPPLPQRVAELARAVTSSAATPYARALALESYLRELPYSYQVAPLPPEGDAVDYFLFDTQRGYCTYYASAMAVLARSLGIPARVAVGYAPGEYDPATRTYAVYERDAHAWPELYIDGRWLPFEPTPIRPAPQRVSTSVPPEVALPAPAPEPARSSQLLVWVAALALVMILFVAGLLLKHWQRPRSPAAQVQQQIERLGERLGVTWSDGATLDEYGALLAARLGGSAEALGAITALIGRARYGGRPLDAAEERTLRAGWTLVSQESGVRDQKSEVRSQ